MPTPPKEHRANTTYMVTKRTMFRIYLLKHSDMVTRIVLYCLGYTLDKRQALLHAFILMSNHFHMLMTCLDGNKPDFFRDFDSLTARALNCHLGRCGAVYDTDSPNALECVERDDIIGKAAYALVNPVTALLCKSRSEWPGGISTYEHLGGTVIRIEKPPIFFSDNMPDYVEIRIAPPPGFASLEEWQAEVTEEADLLEERIRDEAARDGKTFKTKDELAKTDRYDNPWGTGRSGFVPHIAAKSKWARIASIERMQAFREAYREARAAFLAGDRDVEWPYGTYKMRRIFGCPCAGPPPT